MAALRFSGSNVNTIRSHNMEAVLMSLLYEGQISRAGLAKGTSLSSATITNLTSELLDAGIVAEVQQNGQVPRRVGRPRTMLQLVPSARYAVGVHIGVGLFRVAITDLFARIVANRIVEYNIELSAEAVLQRIAAEIDSIVAESGIEPKRILGIGVGASGLVDHRRGLNVLAPRLGWRDVDLCATLRPLGDVTVDNNVRAMAIGEAFFGAGRDVNALAFVYGRVGVGAGLVINGEVYRGNGAGAGEIGHMIMIPEGGQPCRCGQTGCLETLVSEDTIIQKAEEIAEQHPHSLVSDYLNAGEQDLIERIFDAARDGDDLTKEMIASQMEYLGIALACLVNMLNPEMILLGGMFAQGDDIIRPIVQDVMREKAFGGLGDQVALRSTSFGWRAGVIGAASLALMDFFYQKQGKS
jgi:predicted NBD/HSP70 family sugar kinase